MGRPRPSLRRWWMQVIAAGTALTVAGGAAVAQPAPHVVQQMELADLAGAWYEVASTGTWWHRGCVSDTRYRFDPRGSTRLGVSSVCVAARGIEHHRGALRGSGQGDGHLSIRFAPPLLAWLPATWSDFWVLAIGDRRDWLLIGDDSRERLLILSRFVALDESALAWALAEGRRAGYVIDRLAPVPQPSGATGIAPRR